MAESVDALVSNTSGATHPGSTPGLGTRTEKVYFLRFFIFSIVHYSVVFGKCLSLCMYVRFNEGG